LSIFDFFREGDLRFCFLAVLRGSENYFESMDFSVLREFIDMFRSLNEAGEATLIRDFAFGIDLL
jgi:hypothetical protein